MPSRSRHGVVLPASESASTLFQRLLLEAVERWPAVFGEVFTHNARDIRRPGANLRYRWCVAAPWKLIDIVG